MLDYISSFGRRKNKSVTSFIILQKQVQCESQLLSFVFTGTTRGHYCKEHCRNQSHLWHVLSDNVVEMEISCSNRDENEFAVVISSATFLHRRGESGFVFEGAVKCFLSVIASFSQIFHLPLNGQVSPLLSTRRGGSARAIHKGEEEKILTVFFFSFPCMKSNGNHGNLALYRTELRTLKLSSAWRGELSITLASAISHKHTHAHTHTIKQTKKNNNTHIHIHRFACSFILHMTSQARNHDIFLFIREQTKSPL